MHFYNSQLVNVTKTLEDLLNLTPLCMCISFHAWSITKIFTEHCAIGCSFRLKLEGQRWYVYA